MLKFDTTDIEDFSSHDIQNELEALQIKHEAAFNEIKNNSKWTQKYIKLLDLHNNTVDRFAQILRMVELNRQSLELQLKLQQQTKQETIFSILKNKITVFIKFIKNSNII